MQLTEYFVMFLPQNTDDNLFNNLTISLCVLLQGRLGTEVRSKACMKLVTPKKPVKLVSYVGLCRVPRVVGVCFKVH